MTPLASVAMLEKLALLKIALCRAPALRSASSASFRAVLSEASKRPASVLVSSFPLVMVLPPITCAHPTQRIKLRVGWDRELASCERRLRRPTFEGTSDLDCDSFGHAWDVSPCP